MNEEKVYEREVKAANDTLHKMEEEVNDLKLSYNYSELKASFKPYEMQDQINIVDRMLLKKALTNSWTGHIMNYGSFMNTMKEFDTFEKREASLKEEAFRILVVERAIKRANEYLKANRELLPKANFILESPELFALAHKYLVKIPLFDTFDKQEYRTAIIKQAMTDLTNDNIKKAVEHNIIKSRDIEKLDSVVTSVSKEAMERYKENYTYVMQVFDKASKTVSDKDVVETRVTGVSYANQDGTKRQDILKEMSKEQLPIVADIVRGTFNNKPCIEVKWHEKTIGFIPQAVVNTLSDAYPDSPITGTITEITGGFTQKTKDGAENTASFGCKIKLEIELVKQSEISDVNLENTNKASAQNEVKKETEQEVR